MHGPDKLYKCVKNLTRLRALHVALSTQPLDEARGPGARSMK